MAAVGVELIEFVRPCKNDVNLYVSNISRRMDKETVQVKLLDIFSQFGLIYEVQVMDSSDNSEGSEMPTVKAANLINCSSLYAFVKYYSARAAARAKEQISGKRLLDGQFLKVQFAQRKKDTGPSHPLYLSKCIALANYYFGFYGWSTRIVQMNRIENDKISNLQEMHSAMFTCTVRVEIRGCDYFCDGIGYGGDREIIQQETDPVKRLELLGYAKKLAHRHAFENAFRRVIIVSLDSGKVGVEMNQQDIPDCSWIDNGEEGIINVNQLEETPSSDSDGEENEWLKSHENNSMVNFLDDCIN